MQGQVPVAAIEGVEDLGGAPAPSTDLFGVLAAVLRRWKLIAAITLTALAAICGVLQFIPSLYKSTVEILVFDPQRQIDAAVQKPISPFVEPVGNDAMNTEINVIKSKSVALRVARELDLDSDPEFQPRSRFAGLAEWLGFPGLHQVDNNSGEWAGGTENEKAEKLDQAADALRGRLQVWPDSYIIFVSTTSQSPIKAQRLASTIANDYLASQREARQEALERVATWLKGRVDDLQSRVLETESSIERLKTEMGVSDAGSNNVSERQIVELNSQVMAASAEVEEKRARLEQARRVINTNGDVQSIPEMIASPVLTELRQKQTQLSWRASEFASKVGEAHLQVAATRTELAGVNKQINAEAEHILGNMKN